MARISYLILHVSDLDRSVRFYERLGMKVTGSNQAMTFLDAGPVTLALAPAAGEVDPGDTELVLEVQDIHETFARLSGEIDFRVEPRVVTSTGDRELWASDFVDPDGHIVSITAWKLASSS